jgi:hypothetical protein
MQTLSLAAMEEASRRGRHDADLDDLFLALVLSDQVAGAVLRAARITLDRARQAVDAMHTAQLRSVGVDVDVPGERRIVFHETRGYEWTPRALNVLKRAGGRNSGDATAVLRELLREPSGLIEDLLVRLNTSSGELVAALEAVEGHPAVAPGKKRRIPGITRRVETFVPAGIGDVWSLLADPARMPEWNPSVGSVERDEDGAATVVGASWRVVAPTVYPDGTPAKVKAQFRRRRMELTQFDPPSGIAWRTSYIDAVRANSHVLTIELAPAAGGTQLQLTMSWTRHGGWRRIAFWPLRPLQRFLAWLGLLQIGGGISRVFR